MKSMNTVYDITYTNREGDTKATKFKWNEEKPSERDVAIGIREELLGKEFLLVDMSRDEHEPAIRLLEHYGFKITGIDKADSI